MKDEEIFGPTLICKPSTSEFEKTVKAGKKTYLRYITLFFIGIFIVGAGFLIYLTFNSKKESDKLDKKIIPAFLYEKKDTIIEKMEKIKRIIKSIPEGADVIDKENGKILGITPFEMEGNEGERKNISISMNKHRNIMTEVEFLKEMNGKEFLVRLEKFKTILIDTVPSMANLFNSKGVLLGTTPVEIKEKEGINELNLIIEKNGYEKKNVKIDFRNLSNGEKSIFPLTKIRIEKKKKWRF